MLNEVLKTKRNVFTIYLRGPENQININKIMEMCVRPEADNLQYEREFYVNAVYLHFRGSAQVELVYTRGPNGQRGTLIS